MNEKMPFVAGSIRGDIYGGPFKKFKPGRRLISIKMAEEIDAACDVSVPTEDYSVPSTSDMEAGLVAALDALSKGNDIYVGCMGGTGRTGLFMACMANLMLHFNNGEIKHEGETYTNPVKYVRATYRPHAVETEQQYDYARSLRPNLAVAVMYDLQTVPASEMSEHRTRATILEAQVGGLSMLLTETRQRLAAAEERAVRVAGESVRLTTAVEGFQSATMWGRFMAALSGKLA